MHWDMQFNKTGNVRTENEVTLIKIKKEGYQSCMTGKRNKKAETLMEIIVEITF